MKDKWSVVVKAWFPEGVDDPNLCLLKVKPTNVYYWNASTGSMIQFVKMMAAAVSGKPSLAEGEEGKLAV